MAFPVQSSELILPWKGQKISEQISLLTPQWPALTNPHPVAGGDCWGCWSDVYRLFLAGSSRSGICALLFWNRPHMFIIWEGKKRRGKGVQACEQQNCGLLNVLMQLSQRLQTFSYILTDKQHRYMCSTHGSTEGPIFTTVLTVHISPSWSFNHLHNDKDHYYSGFHLKNIYFVNSCGKRWL